MAETNNAAKQPERPDEEARREYWAEQLDEAGAFMDAMMEHPVEDCGESLIFLPDAARDAKVEVAFSERPTGNNRKRLFYLREGLIEKFQAAAREMNDRGWVLKIEDGFRTVAIQTELGMQKSVFPVFLRKILWEEKGKLPPFEKIFRRLSVLVATAPKIGTHMSGSALDISALHRDDGTEVDRGGPYLELSELTPMGSPFVSPQAQENRREITALMKRHGFAAYPWEFWHYSQGDAYEKYLFGVSEPGRYGAVNFDPETGRVTPIENPTQSLHDPEKFMAAVKNALVEMGILSGDNDI